MWFAAHMIVAFRYRDPERRKRQRKFPVWENIVLIEADTSEDAWEKAKVLGREENGRDDPSTHWNGIPVTMDFIGLRKLVACQGSIFSRDDDPRHGLEVTYNKFTVHSRSDLDKLVAGDPVDIEYEE